MKRISEAELTRAALAKGAVLSIGSRQINASGQRMSVVAAPPKPPAPVALPPPPAAAPPAPLIDTRGFEQAARSTQESSAALLRAVAELVREVQTQRNSQAAPILGWDFEVSRGWNNELKIKATAIR